MHGRERRGSYLAFIYGLATHLLEPLGHAGMGSVSNCGWKERVALSSPHYGNLPRTLQPSDISSPQALCGQPASLLTSHFPPECAGARHCE